MHWETVMTQGTAVQHAAIWCSRPPDTAAMALALVTVASDKGQVEQALGSPWLLMRANWPKRCGSADRRFPQSGAGLHPRRDGCSNHNLRHEQAAPLELVPR
jgi:hypothetical protein